MPKSTPRKLAYQKRYNAKPANVNKRELNNAARAKAMKQGLVKKGDGKDVDHKQPLRRGGLNTANMPSNLRVESVHKNRGWRKGQSGYK